MSNIVKYFGMFDEESGCVYTVNGDEIKYVAYIDLIGEVIYKITDTLEERLASYETIEIDFMKTYHINAANRKFNPNKEELVQIRSEEVNNYIHNLLNSFEDSIGVSYLTLLSC